MAEQVTIQITENKTINVSDVLGNLKISTAAPTTQGLYMLSDIGTYTNLGGLVAEAGKVNYAYYDGSAWSLTSVEMPKDVGGGYASFDLLSKYIGLETSKTSENGEKSVEIYSNLLKKGNKIQYKSSRSDLSIPVFLFRADGTFIGLPTTATTSYSDVYVLNEDFVKIRFYNGTDTSTHIGYLKIIGIYSEKSLPPMRVLILGDSYSEGNGEHASNYVKEMMRRLPSGSSFYSLAVSSATIKDRHKDLVNFPYTSRPVSSDSTNNKNTLGCQIEKLKRLMAGVDLDAGEVKLYETEDKHPNVIIIEGAMNDEYDLDTTFYQAQFTREANNVYYKLSTDSNASLGRVYIKTPISEVDRTIFAGAYRYIAEELLTRFPKAQIFITTSSRLGYWVMDVNNHRNIVSDQQKMCARLLGASVIDWNAEGNINTIQNFVKGSGTIGDPYIFDRTTNSFDTDDAMHPNDSGGVKYGRLAAKVINERFINFLNE